MHRVLQRKDAQDLAEIGCTSFCRDRMHRSLGGGSIVSMRDIFNLGLVHLDNPTINQETFCLLFFKKLTPIF